MMQHNKSEYLSGGALKSMHKPGIDTNPNDEDEEEWEKFVNLLPNFFMVEINGMRWR